MQETTEKNSHYEAIVVGGGAAGLSAATVLARANVNVVVVDAGSQSNRVSHSSGGVFTRDGVSPDKIYDIAREQLQAYPNASIINAEVANISKNSNFAVEIGDQTLTADVLLLAQGMRYQLPDISGLEKLWGEKAWHCPYCHGFEANGKNILVIMSREKQAHVKSILPSWTTEFSFVEPSEIDRVEESEDGVQAFSKNGGMYAADEFLVEAYPTQGDALAESVGCEFTKDGYVAVDEFGKTSVDGVFCAGDQSSPIKQINVAVAKGHVAGIKMHQALVEKKV